MFESCYHAGKLIELQLSQALNFVAKRTSQALALWNPEMDQWGSGMTRANNSEFCKSFTVSDARCVTGVIDGLDFLSRPSITPFLFSGHAR